jgi:ribosome-binding factor A
MKSVRPPSRRLSRVAELLKREISDLIRRELSVDEVGILSVQEVRVAPDLKTASVYVGFVGTAAQRRQAPVKLEDRSARIQVLLGSQLRLKWTPVLRFILDETAERSNRVLAILEELEAEEKSQGPPESHSTPTRSDQDH